MASQGYARVGGDEKECPELPMDTITIQVPSRKPFAVPFFEGQTVSELKQTIATYLAKTEQPLPPARQRLAFNGRVLSDEDVTLHHLGITVDCRVHVFPRPCGSTTVPMGVARPAGDTPVVVVGVIAQQQPNTRPGTNNGGASDTSRSEELRRRSFAYHVLVQWSFRVRLFALMMLFFYGFVSCVFL